MKKFYGTMPTSKTAHLISLTKIREIEWINLESLSEYFDEDEMSLNDHPMFNPYFSRLRAARHRPSSSHTYITFCDSHLYILSQNIRNREFRLDMAATNVRPYAWNQIYSDQITLMRLYNIIRIVDIDDSKQSIENLLYSIDDVRV